MLKAKALPMKRGMRTEEEMYKPTYQALKTLCVGVKIFQTTNTTFLDGTAPDFVFCLEEASDAHHWAVYGVLELKAKDKILNSKANLGQLTNYLLKLAPLQPERTEFWGILSNLATSTVLIMGTPTMPGDGYSFKQFDNIKFEQAIHFIRSSTSSDADSFMVPHLLPFHPSLGQYYQRWASSRKWMIAEFALRPHDSHNITGSPAQCVARMVVKASIPNANGKHAKLHHLNELQNLRLIANTEPTAPCSIPKLVWDPVKGILNGTPDHVQFGITPVGQPISVNVFANAAQFNSAMDKLLDGLNWLHTNAKIIHRDLRLANVVYDMALQTPVLIDYDCAWRIPEENAEVEVVARTFYVGGIICIPRRVLKDYKLAKQIATKKPAMLTKIHYLPLPADDLCAYILFIIALIFPGRFSEFREYEILIDGPEGQVRIEELDRLITDVINSPVWGKWWNSAEKNDVNALRSMVAEVAVWPWVPPRLSVFTDGGSV
ncbi:hypothetical protein L211DRAFT_581077 [Terfezia boudieri ATCC MYA-4762]|uniref:non-specific serine/threonine protein kinase n=1 Tax=Terfezia boudieri ATCC MYA-4762 TaxID=1051890 RepID=A0A3N4LEM5_9PEZI|nr:hypothetical protein L211DRAFT_581077 [Terfezia boudieri ATCC MYA-4762]